MAPQREVRIPVKLSKKQIRWVAKKLGCSEREAVSHIRKRLYEKLMAQLHWETFVVDAGDVAIMPVDELHPTYNKGRDHVLGSRVNP